MVGTFLILVTSKYPVKVDHCKVYADDYQLYAEHYQVYMLIMVKYLFESLLSMLIDTNSMLNIS